ncbi:membrane protein [Cohnella kolymensis]|uniref:Membrane protein n=1 Tax=Cohnella kolymensis TaxID=1590652 RepID=A0ABR5A3F0_9BACL|nr:membrane protein [Cohnella kolymensis]
MAPVASMVLLSFAVSLDGFGVGLTYGVRKIRIPVSSILIISACSGLIILMSMMVGVALTNWMSPHGASAVGACILIGIGCWALIQFLRSGEPAEQTERPASAPADHAESVHKPVLTLELRVFGIMIQILRTPSAADVDRSGIISAGEAFLLGTALSLDAFGAGIGAALVGFPPLATAVLIAASSGFFLWTGTRVGFWAAGWRWMRRLSMLPGIILITMGIFKLL